MIDAHVHVWRIGANGCTWPTGALPAIHRDFDLADYRAATGAAPIDGVMLVQSQEDDADTDWLLSLAAQDALVAGVVGWCDLRAPDRIARLAAQPKLRGLRPMVQDRAADWYDDPELDQGLAAMAAAGLVFEALVRPQHLPALARLAARHPNLRVVIDHAAKPDLNVLSDWSAGMHALAACPRVWCKLSGLVTEVRAGQDFARLGEIVAVLLRTFGIDRILWGSDWPVVNLACGYGDWLGRARDLIPVTSHPAVFHDTAAYVYGVAA